MSSKNKEKNQKSKKNKQFIWKISTSVFFVLFIIFLVLFLTKTKVNDNSNMQETANQTISFIEDSFQTPKFEVKDVLPVDGLYKIDADINGQNITVYTSTNGNLIFVPGAAPINKKEYLESIEDLKKKQSENLAEVKKTDKPKVELFVMSYCPFGTQAEKGILPVINLLKDKIDFKIRFVYYSMHGEKEVKEQTREYCIQKNEPDKYINYLTCFLEDSNSERCLVKENINIDLLNTCVSETDTKYSVTKNLNDTASYLSGRFPLFDIDKADNEKYNIEGSPTLVINDTQVSSARDPESLLTTICSAFNNKPEECSLQLSSTAYGPGFGFDSSGPSTNSQCS